ncbi:hypothetical protein AMK59_8583 [Oryctes borbonicus]|uniref:Peptidase n=1 Tax=Oryctes borbonicus TaxID=1629725 RepID=A0A0T6AZJ3_9SCAR|nr:hypothetical protein AMK59_8583 [Oryctes borbonicus]
MNYAADAIVYSFIALLCNISISSSAPSVSNEANSKTIIKQKVVQQLQIPPIYPDFKQYGRQYADLAQEHWLSQKDSAYSKTQLAAARYLDIKPIVDTIPESKKYGNNGEFHRNIAIGLMNYIDAAGAVMNNIVDVR